MGVWRNILVLEPFRVPGTIRLHPNSHLSFTLRNISSRSATKEKPHLNRENNNRRSSNDKDVGVCISRRPAFLRDELSTSLSSVSQTDDKVHDIGLKDDDHVWRIL